MINEEKVKLMYKVQLFEDKEEKSIKSGKFFRDDYMRLCMIRSFFACIALDICVLGLIVLYNWEVIFSDFTMNSIMEMIKWIGIRFVILIIPSMLISGIIYWIRYSKIKLKLIKHIDDMKKLYKMYQDEEDN